MIESHVYVSVLYYIHCFNNQSKLRRRKGTVRLEREQRSYSYSQLPLKARSLRVTTVQTCNTHIFTRIF